MENISRNKIFCFYLKTIGPSSLLPVAAMIFTSEAVLVYWLYVLCAFNVFYYLYKIFRYILLLLVMGVKDKKTLLSNCIC